MYIATHFLITSMVCLLRTVMAGRTFIFAIPYLYSPYPHNDPEGRVYIINNGPCTAHVTIRTPKNLHFRLDESASVQANSSHMFLLRSRISLAGSEKAGKGVEVTSDQDVTVQVLVGGESYTDAFVVPPIEELGNEHVVLTHHFDRYTRHVIDVAAAHDNTTIRILLNGPNDYSLYYNGQYHLRGEEIDVNLDAYDTLQLFLYQRDFTGTTVISNKPILVISGAVRCYVTNTDSTDYALDVIRPVTQYGTEYVITPFLHRTTGYLLKIINLWNDSFYNMTTSDGDLYHNETLLNNSHTILDVTSQEILVLRSTYPMMVAQYSKSLGGETHLYSDVSLAVLEPVSRWHTEVSMVTMTTWDIDKYSTQSVTIVTRNETECDILLDGQPVTSNWTTLNGTNYTTTQLDISIGQHTIKSDCNNSLSVLYYRQANYEALCMNAASTVYANNCTSASGESTMAISSSQEVIDTTSRSDITSMEVNTRHSSEASTLTVSVPQSYAAFTTGHSSGASSATVNAYQSYADYTTAGMSSSITKNYVTMSLLNKTDCPAGLWENWAGWTTCSVTCGVGFQSRSRQCQTNFCIGNTKQHQPCSPGDGQCDSRDSKGDDGRARSPFGVPKLTAADYRASACGIGGTTVVFLVVFFVLITAVDLMSFLQTLSQKKMKRSKRMKKRSKITPLD